MKKYYIDECQKAYGFVIKPKIYKFENENILYIFPGKSKKHHLRKAILKSGADKMQEEIEAAFRNKIYFKLITLILKEHSFNQLTLSFSNPLKYLDLLKILNNREITFSLTDSTLAHDTADYFLETFGVPITIISNIKKGILIFENKNDFPVAKNVLKVNISKSMYYLKNTYFPIKLDSLPLLYAALELTGKEISDIIIKPCIIRTEDE